MHRDYRGSVERWFVGIGVAAIPFAYGIYCLIVQRCCYFIGIIHFHYVVTGWAGSVLAIGYIAIGMAIHLQCFWSQHPKLGKIQYSLAAVFVFLFCYGIAAFIS